MVYMAGGGGVCGEGVGGGIFQWGYEAFFSWIYKDWNNNNKMRWKNMLKWRKKLRTTSLCINSVPKGTFPFHFASFCFVPSLPPRSTVIYRCIF